MKNHFQQTMTASVPEKAGNGTSRYRTWLETPHVHEASTFMESKLLYHRHSVELQETGKARVRLRGFTLGRLAVCCVRYGVPAISWVKSASPSWVFSDLLEGRSSLGTDPAYESGKVAVAYGPENTKEIRMDSNAEIVNLRVDEADMRDACRALLGSDLAYPLVFAPVTHGSSRPLETLRQAIARCATTPRYDHPANDRLEAALQEAMLFELLLAWPNSYTSHFDGGSALPRSTRRARDFIRAHAAELPTLGEIANAAGVGARALTMSFGKHLNISPKRYLLQCRLDGARADLLLHRELGMVTNTAHKWGFFNLGQFAARYREQFGELPNETLRKAKSGSFTSPGSLSFDVKTTSSDPYHPDPGLR
jgi:AraC-like DNA-binding protein